MTDVAWVFPGQGSQTVGMGADLAAEHPVVKATFDEADDVLGFRLSELCFHGPEEVLTITSNTQPALLVVGVATARLLRDNGLEPTMTAGHSLGEYTALVVAGALDFADALRTVRLRGQLMEAAAPEGTMAAILGLPREKVQQLCRDTAGIVEPATYNGPGQVVVAGETEAVKALVQAAQEAGARRAVMLNVSGPFHSSLLKGAGEALHDHLQTIAVERPDVPVVSTVTGQVFETVEHIREALARQVSEPVLWEDAVGNMVSLGCRQMVEVGPGRVLQGLIRRINRDVAVAGVATDDDLMKLLQQQKGDESS